MEGKITTKKTYRSLEEMPPEVRRAFEEAMASSNKPTDVQLSAETRISAESVERIIIDGQEFSSVEEMPADIRGTYELAMANRPEETRLVTQE